MKKQSETAKIKIVRQRVVPNEGDKSNVEEQITAELHRIFASQKEK